MADLEVGLSKFADVDRPPEVVEEELRGTDRASRTIARGKRASQAGSPEDEKLQKGTAATQLVRSTPPPKDGSGVRSSPPSGTAVGGTFDAPSAKAPAKIESAAKEPAKAEVPHTAEIGAVVRNGSNRTAEIGTVAREEAARQRIEEHRRDMRRADFHLWITDHST